MFLVKLNVRLGMVVTWTERNVYQVNQLNNVFPAVNYDKISCQKTTTCKPKGEWDNQNYIWSDILVPYACYE